MSVLRAVPSLRNSLRPKSKTPQGYSDSHPKGRERVKMGALWTQKNPDYAKYQGESSPRHGKIRVRFGVATSMCDCISSFRLTLSSKYFFALTYTLFTNFVISSSAHQLIPSVLRYLSIEFAPPQTPILFPFILSSPLQIISYFTIYVFVYSFYFFVI